MTKLLNIIGLMSGTSMDGIDVSLIQSDGKEIINANKNFYLSYDAQFKQKLREITSQKISALKIKEIEIELTKLHFNAIEGLLKKHNLEKSTIDLIGFHGHTIIHAPEKKISWQLGDAKYLSYLMGGVKVVSDFRKDDILQGGQGAPLAHIYHFHLLKKYQKPIAIVNIGGVSNLTYIADNNENNIISCDFCFGNSIIDDLVREKLNIGFDKDGAIAAKGKNNLLIANKFLENEFFKKLPPKSLERNHFLYFMEKLKTIKIADSCVTACYIIGKSLANLLKNINSQAGEILICGGGRDNLEILKQIELQTQLKVTKIDNLGFNGDFIESEAFAFLAAKKHFNSYTKVHI